MDPLDRYREIIETTLMEYTRVRYAYGDIQTEEVFDRVRDRYLLMNVGWDQGKRVHGSLVHIDIIDGNLWIQRDGTETGIAVELIRAGVPKERMVLGFRAPEVRAHIDFTVA
jgi:hypothetical protein